jgi:hypothetical protein
MLGTVGIDVRARRQRGKAHGINAGDTTPVGYLQFENGVLFAEDSTEFSKRIGIEQVTKLSVLPRLELFLQSESLAFSQPERQTAVHEGEVFAGV